MPVKHYLLPDYVLNFNCAMCGECCKRWTIIIDKHTVDRYRKLSLEDPEIASLLSEGLQIKKDGDAVIKFKSWEEGHTPVDEKGSIEGFAGNTAVAPCLSSDGLCSIQKKYGLDALSDTCKIFPRNIYLTKRGWEISLTYSCPAAASSLKARDRVEFYQDPEGFSFPELHGQYGVIGGKLERKKAGKTNYFEVEELLIDIIQTREMGIDDLLILTGIIVHKLKDGDIKSIERYLQNLDSGLMEQLKSIPSQPVFMMKLVKESVDRRLLSQITEKDIFRLLDITYKKLKLLDGDSISCERVREVLEGYNKYYKPFIDDIRHVYENYFVNYIFSKKYYKYKYADAYFLMMFFYVLIRFFSISVCLYERRKIDEDIVVQVICAIERSIGHSSQYYDTILALIKEGGYHRLPYMISLANL